MNASFVKITGADRMHIRLDEIVFDGSPYAMTRTDLFRKNVLAKVKADLPSAVLGVNDLFGGKDDGEAFDADAVSASFRTLRNRGITEALPSYMRGTDGFSPEVFSELDLGSLIRNAGPEALVNLYIRNCFGTYRSGKEETFFRNEIEYILAGKTDDRGNLNAVKLYLAALRTPLNAAYLYTSPVRLEEASMLAAAISGPAAVWTTQAILAAWNLAETVCDVALLLRGERIPIAKTDETWNLSVEKLAERFLSGADFDQAEADGMLTSNAADGLSYDDYLILLLFFENAETKLLRTMDVIQLNMIAGSQSTFSFARLYAGFDVTFEWHQTKASILPERLRTHRYEGGKTYFDAA